MPTCTGNDSDTYQYPKLLKYFEKNKHRPIWEWLEFEQLFKPGRQGIVGILRPKGEKTPKGKYVFKISNEIDYLAQHEGAVSNALNEVSSFCPNFCKYYGMLTCAVDAKHMREGNPFHIKSNHPISKDILLFEYIDTPGKLSGYVRSDSADANVALSSLKQVLMAVALAQRLKRFTHYDLHLSNVMMKKCNPDIVFLYVLGDDDVLAVPSLGYYPVVIDCGCSYIEDLDDGPLWMSMSETHAGFTSDRFDPIADAKLLLITAGGEMKDMRLSKSRKLWTVVKNIFSELDLNWHHGWNRTDKKRGVTDYVRKSICKHGGRSRLFKLYGHECVQILQSLVITPVQEESTKDLAVVCRVFFTEWNKIEDQIIDPFYNLYILKGVVDSARFVRSAYYDVDSRQSAILDFQKMVFERIDEVVEYCLPEDLNFERLLCSMCVLARCIEGVIYKVMAKEIADRDSKYARMPVQTVEHIYAILETNFRDNYVYNKNTTIVVVDGVRRKTGIHRLTKSQAEEVNETNLLCRGSVLWEMLSS